MSLSFRPAVDSDLDRLIEIHQSAFPDPRDVEARRRNFTRNPLGNLGDLRVAERDGTIVGHAFLFSLQVFFGGRPVKVGGFASLGVAPEARGEGVGGALLEDLHALSRDHGDALTLLYPFRQAFYAAHGYAPVSPYLAVDLSPHAIPAQWKDNGDGVPRPATGADRDAMARVHERDAERRTGVLLRPERLWDTRLLDENRRWFVVERRGVVRGYLSFTLTQREAHAAVTLTIDDLSATDEPARRRLLALAGAQRDQVTQIALRVPGNDPLPGALLDPDRHQGGTEAIEHRLGTLVAGPMVRIADLDRAVCARGYHADGEIDLRLPDHELCVAVAAGSARALPCSDGRPWLRLELATLGAILFGALRPSAAERLGLVIASGPEAIATADAMFDMPPFFSEDAF